VCVIAINFSSAAVNSVECFNMSSFTTDVNIYSIYLSCERAFPSSVKIKLLLCTLFLASFAFGHIAYILLDVIKFI